MRRARLYFAGSIEVVAHGVRDRDGHLFHGKKDEVGVFGVFDHLVVHGRTIERAVNRESVDNLLAI
jgi:hypothetical protein